MDYGILEVLMLIHMDLNNNHWENGKNALDMEKRMDRMETKTSYVLKSMAFPNQCTLW